MKYFNIIGLGGNFVPSHSTHSMYSTHSTYFHDKDTLRTMYEQVVLPDGSIGWVQRGAPQGPDNRMTVYQTQSGVPQMPYVGLNQNMPTANIMPSTYQPSMVIPTHQFLPQPQQQQQMQVVPYNMSNIPANNQSQLAVQKPMQITGPVNRGPKSPTDKDVQNHTRSKIRNTLKNFETDYNELGLRDKYAKDFN